MSKTIIFIAIFAYMLVAVKLFKQLDQVIDVLIQERFGNDKAHAIIANICVILCCLFWPVLIFLKTDKDS